MKHLPVLFLFSILGQLNSQSILQYHAVLLLSEPKQVNEPPELAIRSFVRDTQLMYLLVNPDSLRTRIAPAHKFRTTPTDWVYLNQHWADKPYIKSLAAARLNDAPLQDAGITHTNNTQTGIALTADLCPSHLPLDRRVLTALIQTSDTTEWPIPIALSVSGLWIQVHKSDLGWLEESVKKGNVAITWTNHTLHHHWDKNLPLSENFLLERGTDLTTEVLGNEELMLENGLLPSCLFRFPGLVSDKMIADQILNWGLIPVGSDAWLAKGQHPQAAGSIVLIHANGNEPLGIDDFLNLLQKEKASLKQGQWRLLDLREELRRE